MPEAKNTLAAAQATVQATPAYDPKLLTAHLFPNRTSLTVREVAEALLVTKRHLMNLIAAGQLSANNVGVGGRNNWRIPVASLDAFLVSRDSHRYQDR